MLGTIGNQFRKPSGLLGKVVSKIMKKGNISAYNKIIPALDIIQNDKILEIGYGHGLGIDMISSDFDCFVSGIDFSELMFKEASKRNKKHIENNKVELHYGDFLSFEMNSNQYDKVFCINVIYFWNQLDKPFTKIYTGLKDDGIFCMYMAHRDNLKKMKFTKDDIFNKYTIDQVVDQLKLSGFMDIHFDYNNGYLIKCRKARIHI
jgi:cyclopropane fatty-acyl-phospholipid synthase-like methyltransferase